MSKIHYGNFTFYSKAVVTTPKNVIIAKNVFCQGYVRGAGVDFFEQVHEEGPEKVRGYEPETGEHTASIISVVIPYGTADRLPNPMSLEAHHRWRWDADRGIPRPGRKMGEGEQTAAFLGGLKVSKDFKFNQYGTMHDNKNTVFQEFERHQNTIVYRGHQFSYCPTTKQHTAVTVNTGHWGPNVYPGCGRVRAGEMKYLEKCDYRSAISVAR